LLGAPPRFDRDQGRHTRPGKVGKDVHPVRALKAAPPVSRSRVGWGAPVAPVPA
jgi:hypothetical protein